MSSSATDPPDRDPPSRALLAWYDRHRRPLPWRRDNDPYRVWLSEIMLQQTRVEVVIPYFERFLERFPTVEALAAAELDEVLALWSGLGYYRRARQLHAAAARVVALGGFPATVEGLRALPGIGEYTSAAVASIAFGIPVPVMDGNVERVMSRLLGQAEDPKRRPARRGLLAAAGELLDRQRPGDSNQALMELGATVCTPRGPRCLLCPLQPGCRGAASGDPERYPAARRRRRVEEVRRLVALVEGQEGVLLFRRRQDSELLAGMWELPWADLPATAEEAAAEAAAVAPSGAAAALAQRYGGRWRLGGRLATVRHGITHRSFTIAVHRATVEGEAAKRDGGYFDRRRRRDLPLSSLVGKVLAAV